MKDEMVEYLGCIYHITEDRIRWYPVGRATSIQQVFLPPGYKVIQIAVKDAPIVLQPCPFCGNEVELEVKVYDSVSGFKIECSECSLTMGVSGYEQDKQELIERWNNRT